MLTFKIRYSKIASLNHVLYEKATRNIVDKYMYK